jgi:hypothetical protein
VDVPEQPLETFTASKILERPNRQLEQDLLAPQITPIPGYAHQHAARYLEKRQTFFTSTVTSVVSTYTVSITSTRLFTSTISARATATVSTTSWQTVTSVINAKKTVTSTTTLTVTPGVSISNVVYRSAVSPTGSTSSASSGAGGPNDVNASSTSGSATGAGGLSKGAQAGIGAGTGAGSLIICLILAFWFRRRRKSRKERNQEMIDGAVSSAMAAQQQQLLQQQQQQMPAFYHDHNKHLSTTTYSTVSPNTYSPSPPLHAPQPGYVYPPPPSRQQPTYNTNPMEFPEALGPQAIHSPHGSVPPYGSEMDGSSANRYELPLYGSPQPLHPGPYSDVPHPGHYSDLPEVRR